MADDAVARQPVSSEDYNLEAFIAEEKSLADHLSDQLGLAVDDPAMRLIGQTLVNEIDEGGYLRVDLEQVAERLGAPLALVEQTLSIVQTFEPAGVGARDLAECLAIQLRERDRFDPAMAALVAHLDLVARRDMAALRRLCGVDDEDLTEMLKEIRAPQSEAGRLVRLGTGAAGDPRRHRALGPDGGWLVELNSGTLPKAAGQPELLRDGLAPEKEGHRQGISREALQTANWLVKRSRPARAHHPQGRHPRSCGSRTRSSPRASSTCGRSI